MDIADGGGYGSGGGIMNSSISSTTNTLSKFHRSMSMGQGWPAPSLSNRYSYQNDEHYDQKVVLRRKNVVACDSG